MNKEELINYANTRTENPNVWFKSYNDYITWQTKNGASFESDSQRWSSGQERYIDEAFFDIDKNIKIMDVCSGDGVGLRHFKKLGFTNVLGVEVNDDKIERCVKSNCEVIKHDICLNPFDEKYNESFDLIYSSHSLEHVLNPIYTINNLLKLLKPGGLFYIVLPYLEPNGANPNNPHFFMVHCGTIPLKLHINDSGESLIKVLKDIGLELIDKKFDSYREPEIWLKLKKI